MFRITSRVLRFSLLLCSTVGASAGCATYQITPNNFTVENGLMPYHELHSCGPGPPDFEARWSLTEADVVQLEQDIQKLRKVKATSGGLIGWKIDDLNEHHRYYYGIIVEGRRLIYISNGGSVFCDCGPGCWAALYDPAKGRFVNLEFGGIA